MAPDHLAQSAARGAAKAASVKFKASKPSSAVKASASEAAKLKVAADMEERAFATTMAHARGEAVAAPSATAAKIAAKQSDISHKPKASEKPTTHTETKPATEPASGGAAASSDKVEFMAKRAIEKKGHLLDREDLRDIFKQKAKESDLPTHLKGEFGEKMAEYMFKYLEGYELMPTKYSGNRGIDIMAVKYDASGVVERIMIVECKFSKDGKLKLGKANSEYNRGRKMEQLSDCWLLEQMENRKFRENNFESVMLLEANKDKIYFKASVTDPSGRTRWIDGGKYSEDGAKNSLENLIIKANKKKK